MKASKRSEKPEIMDLGPEHYTAEEYRHCLKQLGRVGQWLGGDRAAFQAFHRLSPPPNSILDVGCGGGPFTRRLAMRFPQARVVGIDISEEAIAYAREQPPLDNLSFEIPEGPELNVPKNSFEVVTSTLVCHHLTDEAIIDFFRRASRAASRSVIVNDLHRHPFASIGFGLIAPVLFRNRLITADGLLSIRKGFKASDWKTYLKEAGLKQEDWTCKWKWAFRWIVEINTTLSS